MKKKRKNSFYRSRETYSVDRLFRETTRNLIRDFQNNLQDPTLFQNVLECINDSDVRGLRSSKPEMSYTSSVASFKAAYQVASLDKRYRYQDDIYSDEELLDMAVAKFEEVQVRLRHLDWDQTFQDERMVKILRGARTLCYHVLGSYDDTECRQSARFGTGASVGVPAAKAHLAQRFAIPISGTDSQISWWKSEYDSCPHFGQWLSAEYGIEDPNDPRIYKEVDYLKLTFVPKSHKSVRGILANTTIGSYQSAGIGEMIRARLKTKLGLDVRRLQHQHRKLAELESAMQKLCTMDLQSASDSLSDRLVQTLVPPCWYSAMNIGRNGYVGLPDGSVTEVETFATMGIGFTFTLQTLLFYSLIWSIQAVDEVLPLPKELRRWKTPISVYGDDLIFGSSLYPAVCDVFRRLGIVVNEDKTFHNVPFRESCGGDYYHGWDVRPFQPEVSICNLPRLGYEALLYKFINGLLAKWTEHEIWGTLQFLCAEVERTSNGCKLVPITFPEDSGIRVEGTRTGAILVPDFLRPVRTIKPKYVGHGIFRFPILRKKSKEKEELRHGPYYWSKLRSEPLVSPHGYDKRGDQDWSSQPFYLTLRDRFRDEAISWVDEMGEDLPSLLITRKVVPDTASDNETPLMGLGRATGSCCTLLSPPCKTDALYILKDYVVIPHTSQYVRQLTTSTFGVRS